MITKELKDRWIAALRSGKYKQGQRRLRWFDDTFCCLGVLCDVRDGRDSWKEMENLECYLNKTGNTAMIYDVSQGDELAVMNDNGDSFSKIADWIEANVPTTEEAPEEDQNSPRREGILEPVEPPY